MKRTQIIEELAKRGYEVEPIDVRKNGVSVEAIKYTTGVFSPVVYMKDFEDMDLEEAVNRISEVFNREVPHFEVENLYSADFLKKNVRIGVQPEYADHHLVSRQSGMNGIDEYIYINVDMDGCEGATVKVTKDLLLAVGVEEESLWQAAEKNTFAETQIMSMGDLFPQIGNPGLWIISNKKNYRGASAVLDKKALSKFGEEQGMSQFFVLPSSIHECLLLADDGNTDLDYLVKIVQEINASVVSPEDKLSDEVFTISL